MSGEGAPRVVPVRDLPLSATPATEAEGVKVRVALSAEMGAEQYWVAHTEFPPGSGHRVHRHPNRDQAIYVLSGELVQTGPDGPLGTVVAGDALHVPAGAWHGLENHGSASAFTLALFGGTGSGEVPGYELMQDDEEETT